MVFTQDNATAQKKLAEANAKKQMWKVNEKYLDNRIQAGSDFEFTSNPAKLVLKSYGYRELQHLRKNGYHLVHENEIWIMIQRLLI